jgi:hypothetical protein
MSSQSKPGIQIGLNPSIDDGTLMRVRSPRPGVAIDTPKKSICSPTSRLQTPALVLYCNLWSQKQRQAFLRGFTSRADEVGQNYSDIFEWIKDSCGLGDQAGDFDKAWESFADGVTAISQLAWKLFVIIGVPIYLMQEERAKYVQEFRDLGFQITEEIRRAYLQAYEEGGIPQCAGRLMADIIVLALEIMVAKGATSAARIGKFIPENLRQVLKLSRLPKRVRNLIRLLASKVHDPDGVLKKLALGAMNGSDHAKFEGLLVQLEKQLVNFDGPVTLRITQKEEIWIRASDTFDSQKMGKVEEIATKRVLSADEQGRYLADTADRNKNAVLSEWNRMNVIEEQAVPQNSIVLEGKAKPQSTRTDGVNPMERLPGGGKQIFHAGQLLPDGTVGPAALRRIVDGHVRTPGGLRPPRRLPDQ